MGRFDLDPEQITEGSIPRALVLLAAPLFAQNMVLVAQQVADLFWVGRYSGDAVAAIGLGSPVIWLLLNSTIAAAFVGTQVLVSQRFGADDEHGARQAAFTGLVLTVVLGVVVGVAMFLGVGGLLDLVAGLRPGSAGDEVAALATVYLQVIALGISFAGMSDVVEAAFVARGDSRAALYMNVTAVVANVGLDPVLIFGWGPVPALGIRGAALATVAGYATGFFLGSALAVRGRAGGILSWSATTLDLDEFRELLDVGLPNTVQGVARSAGGLVMVGIVFAVAGAPGLAAYTVGSRVGTLSFRSVTALRNAAQSIVGQNLGAGKPGRARETTWTGVRLGAGLLTAVAVVQLAFPRAITGLFVPEMDGRALELSVRYLQIAAVGYPATGFLSLVKAGFNGARRTKTTMVASIVRVWLLRIPMAAAVGLLFPFGVVAVFWTSTVAGILAAVGLGAYYLHATAGGMYDRAAAKAEASTAD